MFSVIYFVRRKTGMSPEAFERYWRDVHVDITLRHALLRGYRIGISRGSPDAAESPFDGYAVLTYDSREDYEADGLLPETQVSKDDVPNFLSDIRAMFVEETLYRDPAIAPSS